MPAMALRRISALPRRTTTTTTTPTSTTASTSAMSRKLFHTTPTTKNTTTFPEVPVELESQAPSIGRSPVIKPLARRPRNARNTRWTPELDEKLLELRKGNRTWEAISLAMGRSTSACADRYYTALDPALRNWTPAMFAKLNQMVEDGEKWSDIAVALNAKIVACQNQWRTLGNGKYRIKGIFMTSQSLSWTPYEMEAFWAAWIRLSEEAYQDDLGHKLDWEEFSAEVKTKSPIECRKAFKLLVNHALKDAPGWVKLETVSYVSETTKVARARKHLELKEKNLKNAAVAGREALNLDDEDLEDDDDDEMTTDDATRGTRNTPQQLIAWTDEEHKALFEAVERYGLFSGWTKIRNEVKPDANDEDVETEYYHVSGIQERPNDSDIVEIVPVQKGTMIHGEWTVKEAARLSQVLTKYSHMPIWAERAEEIGVSPTEEDYEILFKNNREHPIKRLSKKELKALEAPKDGRRRVRGRGKKFLLKEVEDPARPGAGIATTPAVREPVRRTEETITPTTKTTHQNSDNNNDDEEPNEQRTELLWNADRTLRLRRLVGQQQLQERSGHAIDWSWIAEHIGPGFNASTCITKWQSLPEHSSIKVEPARFWDLADIRLLEQGILAHGNQWVFIQRDFLPERTTDSIRRKVSNLQKKHEHLIVDVRATAVALKGKYPDLDVEETVKNAILADESCTLWGRLNDLLKQYRENPRHGPNGPRRRESSTEV
ncbi:hypothetical protein KI688_003068 [Linnemannia hyalina]|uniref:Myb-like domain-containing protein n=1 Tax=Linnemannia hyalina TaxID=64524 RepID=A0A9P8BR24_9FUNG|nr:hypothetical protein KI688_003068 [Linnemannia hyalina]